MNKKMCLLMATVVTVNTLGAGFLPAMQVMASEVTSQQVEMTKLEAATPMHIAQPYNVQVVRKEQMALVPTGDMVAPLTWTSSNPHIATVDGSGQVSALEKGFSLIKVTDAAGQVQTWKVDVMYMNPADMPQIQESVYAALRTHWLGTVIGVDNDMTSSNVQRVIARVESFTEQHWNSMNKDGGAIWSDNKTEKYATDPAHTREMYLRLEWLAKGYTTPESKYYGDKDLLAAIEYALEWLHENAYGIQEQYGNWWQWEIGIPKALNNICVMLYDELGKEKVMKYTDVIYFHQPDPFHSGASGVSPNAYRESEAANRVDVSLVSLVMGMLRGDYEQLIMTRDAISSLLKYEVRNADGTYIDGFYEDGSFVQHGHVPYVGTYGNVFLTGASTVAKALQDTPWEIKPQTLQILTEFGVEAFAPFIYKGAALDMVRGRAVARSNETDRSSGHGIMGSFLLLSEVVEPQLAAQLKSYAKTWMTEDTSRIFTENTNNINLINLAEEILNDTSIKAVPLEAMHKNFSLMDRAVHRGPDYLFGLSMFSNRISNFEYMNGENKRGWHTADGMTYLYNDDLAHYSEDYWNTVNPYRLPGTTVDTVKLDVEGLANNADNGQKLFSKEDWVGGSVLGNYGVSGMALSGDLRNQNGTDYAKAKYKSLEAKKSYFMFDDEIVCLGAGINSTDNSPIETIVENRKIKEDASNKVTINGKEVVAKVGDETSVKANWAHLEGNLTKGTDIGYYFPSGSTLALRKVANTGSWGDVKNGDKAPAVTKNYVEMWFEHGTNPTGDTYDYVLLPGKSAKDVEKYAKKADVEVVANTPTIQAVQENDLGILAANFWNDEVATVAGLTVNKKASVMVQEGKKTLAVAVSDPTMKNTGVIAVELDQEAFGVISKDPAITVLQTSPTIKFTVDVDGAEGQSFNVQFNLKKNGK
ncbi:MAG: polysaccharide lyase family 8 super-sandwich domain-containing protein [Cellulosilyticaceae bacterium]